MDAPARLTITRSSPDDGKQRQVILKLDDEEIATLLYGRSVTRDIPAGHHRLRADNTWNRKTVEFDAAPGEEISFSTVSRVGRFTWWMVTLLGAGPMYVSLEQVSPSK